MYNFEHKAEEQARTRVTLRVVCWVVPLGKD
jgi:hypothetical protein